MKENNLLKLQSSVSWPSSDMYFSLGVFSIINFLKKSEVREEFYFMKVSPEVLIEFLSELNEILKTRKKIILISDRSLLPLSLFLFEEKHAVYTVFESNITIDDIVKKIINGITEPSISNKPNEIINHSDFRVLEDFSNRRNIQDLKSTYALSTSTIYYRRKVVARKFMTDKIHKIFIK